MQNITSMFFSGGKLYFTQYGQPNLYSRSFNPDSGIITEDETSYAGVDLSNVSGAFLSGGNLYYASRTDGSLHRVAFNAGVTDPSTDTVVSGPSLDGNDWRARGMFLYGTPAKPTASFTASCTLMSCSFNAAASTPASGLTYSWAYGDGSTDTGVSPTHTYSTAGSHTVTLTVTDPLSQTATSSQPVSTSLGVPPTAAFTSSCTLLACSFDGTSSTAPSGGVASYAWNYGDGQTDSGATVSHTYAAAGSYTVTLTVTDALGQTSTTTHPVVVTALAYVGSNQSAGKLATQTVTVPAAVTTGNALVLVASTAGTTAPTAPAGWTLVKSQAAGTRAHHQRLEQGRDRG